MNWATIGWGLCKIGWKPTGIDATWFSGVTLAEHGGDLFLVYKGVQMITYLPVDYT